MNAPVAPADALACVIDAQRQYEQRYGESDPLHAALAAVLFVDARSDFERAVEGHPYRPTLRRRRPVLEELRVRGRAFSESSFSGNKRIQLDLKNALDALLPYESSDGRLLRVIGPEHKRGGATDLYLTVEEVRPPSGTPAGPKRGTVDDHEARVQRLAAMIAAWFAAKLLRLSPTAVARFERHAKKRGVGYAIAAIFGLVACTGAVAVYRLSLSDIELIAVSCVVGVPSTGANSEGGYLVMWARGSRPVDDYFVLRNGVSIATADQIRVEKVKGRDVCIFVDEDRRPGREVTYRVGYGQGLGRKVTPPVAMDDLRCQQQVDSIKAGAPIRPSSDLASLPMSDVRAATTAGRPTRFYFPFARTGALTAPIDARTSDDVLQTEIVRVDFGDGTIADLPANAIRHTYTKPGRYTVAAHDPEGRSTLRFSETVEVQAAEPSRSSRDELCWNEGSNCFTLTFQDVPPDATPQEKKFLREPPHVRVTRGETATFVVTFDRVEWPWQYGLGSTLLIIYDDGTKETLRYELSPGQLAYPIIKHQWARSGTYKLRMYLLRKTNSGHVAAFAAAVVVVE